MENLFFIWFISNFWCLTFLQKSGENYDAYPVLHASNVGQFSASALLTKKWADSWERESQSCRTSDLGESISISPERRVQTRTVKCVLKLHNHHSHCFRTWYTLTGNRGWSKKGRSLSSPLCMFPDIFRLVKCRKNGHRGIFRMQDTKQWDRGNFWPGKSLAWKILFFVGLHHFHI